MAAHLCCKPLFAARSCSPGTETACQPASEIAPILHNMPAWTQPFRIILPSTFDFCTTTPEDYFLRRCKQPSSNGYSVFPVPSWLISLRAPPCPHDKFCSVKLILLRSTPLPLQPIGEGPPLRKTYFFLNTTTTSSDSHSSGQQQSDGDG